LEGVVLAVCDGYVVLVVQFFFTIQSRMPNHKDNNSSTSSSKKNLFLFFFFAWQWSVVKKQNNNINVKVIIKYNVKKKNGIFIYIFFSCVSGILPSIVLEILFFEIIFCYWGQIAPNNVPFVLPLSPTKNN
jgi:hypothetical protein